MKRFLNPEYDCIFIILGKGCNMRCKYCLQTPFNRKETPVRDLKLVADFIRDAAINQSKPLSVQFFGGEPLLYMSDIKKFVRVCKGTPNIYFSFISNGTLIDEELIYYFNENNIRGCISWDGTRSKEIRGQDVFADKGHILLKLKNLGISAIISEYCYPKDMLDAFTDINKRYVDIHGHSINLVIEEFLDTGIDNVKRLLAKTDKLKAQMEELVEHYRSFQNGEPYNEAYKNFVERHLKMIRNSVKKDVMIPFFTRCGDGTRVVNIDMQGNLYKCHNHEEKIGTVHDNWWNVLEKSMLADNVIPHRKECSKCHVAPLCLGGCALIQDNARKAMCDLHKAFYSPIIDYVLEISRCTK